MSSLPSGERTKPQCLDSNRNRSSMYCLGAATSPLTWPWETPGKSSLFWCPQREKLAPCPGVHTLSTAEEEPHTGTWCQECSLPGAWRLHGRAAWLLGQGCSQVTRLTIPHCTLQSRLCAQLRSITSTPHALAMAAIIQHHCIAQRWRTRPREGRQMVPVTGLFSRGRWKASALEPPLTQTGTP